MNTDLSEYIIDLAPVISTPPEVEVRREERFDASWLIVVALPDGREIHSSAKDVSLSGARLAIPAKVELPPVIVFRILGKNFVVRARVAWRRGDYVGVVVEKTAALPAPGSPKAKPGKGATPLASRSPEASNHRGVSSLAARR